MLYTFILEFRGGTYVSQVFEKNLREATIVWSQNLNKRGIKHLGLKASYELRKLFEEESPQLIDGLINVWCYSAILKSGSILINIVGT
jgi:hypothetical protein